MGDTSAQENRIREQVRLQMNKPPKRKRSWQIPVIASAATALAIFLFSSTIGIDFNSADKGRGIAYDPLDDLVEIKALKQEDALSAIDYTQFELLPTVQSLQPLQYVDSQVFTLDGKKYRTVIERQRGIYDEVSYEQGDVVRTMRDGGSHLPIYEDEYYEVVAVPGDRVVLKDGKLKVNGHALHSDLMDKYEALNITIVGGYEQRLNAREYLLLNYFPAQGTVQAATINAVHKIYGEVVGLAKVNEADTVYGMQSLVDAANYGPEAYFDLFLYDLIFGDGTISEQLTIEGATFPYLDRVSEYFIEASYRTVTFESDTKAIIRYDYGRQGGNGYEFAMYKMPNSNIWQWGQ